uniref:Uncharacterized mitochondrial protein AtMg00810-like n=1 Tax=Tanacetum cinerariifolium TaxID=118510 RepID=A0A699HEC7_TANCI|nr:uncharacterized mitochondrial protein AtMg00810-like [Tanacetum cinerariifolium]
MSSMGELTFFLGLHVKQKPDRIFINQDKYVAEILRKFGLTDGKSASTPIYTEKPLLMDPDGEDVDVYTYKSMIGSLMYLTSSRPDIMFAVCACARFQVTPKVSHLHTVKRIFRYLNGKPHLGLWYLKDSPFNLVAYSDSDYAGASLDRKSTTGGCQFLGCRLIFTAVSSKFLLVGATGVDVVNKGAAGVDVDVVPATADEPSIPSPTPTTQPPPPSQELPSTSQVKPTPPPSPITQPSSSPQQPQPLQPTHDVEHSMDLLHTLLKTCTNLTKKVEALKQDKATQALEIIKLNEKDADVQGRQAESQAQIYKIDQEHADKVLSMHDDKLEPAELKEVVEVVTTAKLMKEVVIAAAATITAATTLITVAIITAAPYASRRRKGVGIMVQEHKPLKKKTQIKQDKAYARELEVELNKNINWDDVIEKVQRKEKEDNAVLRFKMDYFKGMSYDYIHPIFEKYFNSNVAFLEKTKEHIEEEDIKALKMTSESLEEKAAKKQKLDEEVEELKKHLQIVPKNDDDVYTEATPLALKVPVVDYAIHIENNKPYFKIIRADGSHLLFLSFLSLLRNFDIEDLEMILLVERRYPLTRVTLDQMLNNVRLEVEEESEVSLELLRFVRQQQQEGFRPE